MLRLSVRQIILLLALLTGMLLSGVWERSAATAPIGGHADLCITTHPRLSERSMATESIP